MTRCACCGLRPPERAALKYCGACGPKIRVAYKGRSREAYRIVIQEVRAAALFPHTTAENGPPPTPYWLELFFNSARLEYPCLALNYKKAA